MKQRWKFVLLAAALCALPQLAQPQNDGSHSLQSANPEAWGFSRTQLEHLNTRMQSYVDERKLAGLSTLIARKGRVIYFEQHGLQDREHQVPMQTNTIFRLASMTKPITSVAVMMLVEQGALRLEDAVEKYLPAFARVQVYGPGGKLQPPPRAITIKDLLMHTSGLTAGEFGDTPVHLKYREAELGKAASLEELVERVTALPLLHQPGTGWSYGLSTDVLARVVEIATGVPFAVFVEQKILQPLRLHDSGFGLPEEKLSRLATAYSAAKGDGLQRIAAPVTSRFSRGNTGMVATVTDYWRFAQMLLNGGELEGVRLLKPETVAMMARNHLPESLVPFRVANTAFTRNGFGLGFAVVVEDDEASHTEEWQWNRGAPPVGAYWWVGAYQTYFWIDPANEIIGVLFAQSTDVMKYPFMQEFHALVYDAFEKEEASH